MREWGEVNMQIGERKGKVLDLIFKKGYAELGVIAAIGSVTVGVLMRSTSENIVCSSVAMVAGTILGAKAGLDFLYIIPSRQRELADEIGITMDEMQDWYDIDHEDFMT